MKNKSTIFTNPENFFDVKNILSGIHKTIAPPEQFSLKNMYYKYISILDSKNEPLLSFNIWKAVLAWEIGMVFRNHTKNLKDIRELEFFPMAEFLPADKKLINKILSKFGNEHRWIIDSDPIFAANLKIFKELTDSKILKEEFKEFYPVVPYIKKFDPNVYWSGESLELLESLQNLVQLYFDSLLLRKDHPLMETPSVRITKLTDPILFLWLNQEKQDYTKLLTPRAVKQIIWSQLSDFKKEQKLFSIWFWTCVRKELLIDERMRVSNSIEPATILKNIKRNNYIIHEKSLVLKIYGNSMSFKERPISLPQFDGNDFEKYRTETDTCINLTRGRWQVFKSAANKELDRIMDEINKDAKFIYTYPYSKLHIYTMFSKDIIDVEHTPPVAWGNVTPSLRPKPNKYS